MRTIAGTLTVAMLLGCSSLRLPGDTRIVHSHHMREIYLTRAKPTDKKLGVTLVRVDPDGAAVITVRKTNETLRAMPEQPFLGERGGEYNVRVFGESGLILRSSNVESQAVVLVRRWASVR